MYLYNSINELHQTIESDASDILIVEDMLDEQDEQVIYQGCYIDGMINAKAINTSYSWYMISKDTLGDLIKYALTKGYRVFDTKSGIEVKW